MTELFRMIRAVYGSQTTDVFEQIIGGKSISFVRFAEDYGQSFKVLMSSASPQITLCEKS